jgi:hypothetical protein
MTRFPSPASPISQSDELFHQLDSTFLSVLFGSKAAWNSSRLDLTIVYRKLQSETVG